MRIFNAFQTTCCFVGLPYGIQWLGTAEFSGSGALWWTAVVVYAILFIVNVWGHVRVIEDIDGK